MHITALTRSFKRTNFLLHLDSFNSLRDNTIIKSDGKINNALSQHLFSLSLFSFGERETI
jgi:hypothetical protein